MESSGYSVLSQDLNAVAPSFYSTGLSYSDATDHMNPATLRGLNPDQTLILVNGKRHHPSSVVNVLSVVSRGSVINDLNTIPVSAIDRVEILRDGASSQYGSDAIAGVINIILKEDTSQFNLQAQAGSYYEGDGLSENFSADYGLGIGKRGGFLHLSSEFTHRNATNRAGVYSGLIYRTPDQGGLSLEENRILDDQALSASGLAREDFRLQLGNSAMDNANVYFNTSIPLSKSSEFYSFGGLNYRSSRSAGDYRLPNDPARNNLSIYPNGFLPEIPARLNDRFLSAGLRAKIAEWDIDLSNTFGSNTMDFYVENSLNASMGNDSPTSFESGGVSFHQNTTNLDMTRKFSGQKPFPALSVAAGAEFRVEKYRIRPGEEASYINEDQIAYPGAQGFPGYQPVDETDRSRSDIGVYTDLAIELNPKILIEMAGRYEDYSDFGDHLSGKVAARYSPFNSLSFRGSVSSSFRAPSLHQKYYSNTGSYYFGGSLFEILTAPNNSPLASAFGIPDLKEETGVSYNLGAILSPGPGTSFSVDFYQVDVKDRIVLSSTFYAFNPAVQSLLTGFEGIGGVQFFTNAVDTRNRGVDLVFHQNLVSGSSVFRIAIGMNLNKTEVVGSVKSTPALENANLTGLLFDRQARALMEIAQPGSKLHGSLQWETDRFNMVIRTIRFGKVSYRGIDESPGELARDQDYSARWLSDLKLSYRVGKMLWLFVGANNVFNVFPEKNNEILQNSGRFPYNTAVTQFGYNGGYYYAGIRIKLVSDSF